MTLPAPARPPERPRRVYAGLAALERYLRSIGALEAPIEDLGELLH